MRPSYGDAMAWDAQWSSGWVNFLPNKAIEDLRLALKERCDALGVSMPTGWTATWLTANRLPSAACFAAFQSKINTLLAYYMDHTVTYDGASIKPPLWSESDIGSHTTIGARLPAPAAGYLRLDAWLQQQRELLNLMRWVKIYDSGTNQPPYGTYAPAWTISEGVGKTKNSGGLAWVDVVANFKVASWSSGSAISNELRVSKSSGAFTIVAVGQEIGINEVIANPFQYSAEHYWLENGGYASFYPVGVLDEQGKWNLLYTLPEGNGDREFDLMADAVYDSAIDSFSAPAEGITVGATALKKCIIIAKFTGPNGFTYKDW